MEATGIYWLCPYEVLEKAGLQVVVVNGKYVKNLPGRKTDMSDCQWQATLHAHGLLRPGFVPPEQVRRLQDYLRLRSDHIVMAGSHEQHMQKALERMNLKIPSAAKPPPNGVRPSPGAGTSAGATRWEPPMILERATWLRPGTGALRKVGAA
jgi:hypothetical protein